MERSACLLFRKDPYIITSRVSCWSYKNGTVRLCVCVCPSVSALTAEPFDIWSQNLVQALTVMISWMSLMAKVKGQGHRVKNLISMIFWYERTDTKPWLMASWHDVMTSRDVIGRRHTVVWHHGMTPASRLREMQQHFSVFTKHYYLGRECTITRAVPFSRI